MGLAIANNLRAINANNFNTKSIVAGKKSMEKLSSGLKINRAGDNASGLAVSEKLRSQIRGLKQATANSNDAISLIQTAEGGLNETHSILQRMRELAVQSANGTYKDDTDREAIDLEVQALKSEVDRISSATEYNTIKLLDGSLGGSSNTTNSFGATFGIRADNVGGIGKYSLTSNITGVSITFSNDASGVGGELAEFNAAGTGIDLKIKLAEGKFYTNDEINSLIQKALVDKDIRNAPSTLKFVADAGGIDADAAAALGTTDKTVPGIRSGATAKVDLSLLTTTDGAGGTVGSSDEIRIIANNYGSYTNTAGTFEKLKIATDVDAGKEWVEVVTKSDKATTGDELVLHMATGKEYTEQDVHNLLAKAGYDYQVILTDAKDPDGSTNGKVTFTNRLIGAAGVAVDADTVGQGVGKPNLSNVGEGLIFQIGANGTADQRVSLAVQDMSSTGLGISSLNVSTRGAANDAIGHVDAAIKAVSMQRSALGAMQNRLEYTVNNLTTTHENLTAAESQIRDTDMAEQVIENTKQSILQQASQAMLAQANQAPQSVLQLLG